jgi:zinc protease
MRTVRAIFVFILGCWTYAAADLEVPFTEFTLPNGLHVILHEDHTVPMVSTNIWYFVGSSNESPGRTGFAHLFEHLMFEGSGHVEEGEFDTVLEAAGGDNNGSTNVDRTNYWISVPSNALEVALFLESDRMGYLLDTMTPELVDGQREVVKNERRQSYETRPYGMADIRLDEMLYPPDYPYHWPTIGYMPDLNAATYQDVTSFFKRYYAPNNASLVIAGDIDTQKTKELVEKWFGEIPRGETVEREIPPTPTLSAIKKETIKDQVQLPRRIYAWLSPKRFAPGDAALDVAANILAGGKNARLYKRLVYDMQVAQSVEAYQASQDLVSSFQVILTAKPGQDLEAIQAIVDEEIRRLQEEPPSEREVQRAKNEIEAAALFQMEKVGGFGGKADRLNSYYRGTGNPDYFAQDLARYQALTPQDIQKAVVEFLPLDRRVELTVVPGDEQ